MGSDRGHPPLNSADVIFVANNRKPGLFRNDPAYVYRCENLGLALQEQGVSVRFAHRTEVDGRERAKVAVFHRPLASLSMRYRLSQLRRQGVTLLADFDDLVFDESMSRYSPGVMNGLNPHWWVRRRYRLHRKALPWFDGVTVSTEPLAARLARMFPGMPVMLLPNAVHMHWRHNAPTVAGGTEVGTLTYFPGTRSHDRDFAQIVQPLSGFLLAHPEVRLHITGPLRFELDAHPGQIRHRERLPFAEYQSLVRRSWLNLAPLEDTPFNMAKSALKVIEAGFWGIPTVCSANPDVTRFAGAGALIASTGTQWRETLESMLDAERYRAATDGLSEKVLARADVELQAARFAERWL